MNSTGFDEYRHLTEAARRLEAYKRMEPCIQNDGKGVIYRLYSFTVYFMLIQYESYSFLYKNRQ